MHVTIIGAGFSGSALAAELARRGGGNGLRVTLVGVTETFGRGVAYGTALPEHLLNVRAKDLGADADDPGGFAAALALGEQARLDFLPRLAYGDYLQDWLARRLGESAVPVARVEDEAISVERSAGGGFEVLLANGDDFHSDVVVLAVGTLPPQTLSGVGPRLAVHPSYVGWPWQEGALDTIAPEARLLVVGTGLTMADVILSLRRRGHRGHITAISRHGLLPQAHTAQPGAPVELPPRVQQALRHHDLRGLVHALRQLSSVVPDWRTVIDALRPHLQPFWMGLDDANRSRFLRHLRSYWEVLRHRVAPSIAAELDQLRAAGSLDVRPARLLRARRGQHGVEAMVRERGADSAWTGHFDALIRATGLDTDVERTPHPLVSTLRESGLVRGDRYGLGMDTDAALRVRDRSGTSVPGLYCLGPLLRARFWEVTAIPELRVAARDLAIGLLAVAEAEREGAGAAQDRLVQQHA
ncbi:MAG: FAD/NAD(P)-binding protein [Pseudoxanthomonas sp.]